MLKRYIFCVGISYGKKIVETSNTEPACYVYFFFFVNFLRKRKKKLDLSVFDECRLYIRLECTLIIHVLSLVPFDVTIFLLFSIYLLYFCLWELHLFYFFCLFFGSSFIVFTVNISSNIYQLIKMITVLLLLSLLKV